MVFTVLLSLMRVTDSKLNFQQAIFASSQVFIYSGFMLTCPTHAAETYLIILAMLPCKFARSCSRLYRPGDVETDCSPNPVSTGDTWGSGAILHMTGLNKTSFFKIGSCAVIINSCSFWARSMCLRFRPYYQQLATHDCSTLWRAQCVNFIFVSINAVLKQRPLLLGRANNKCIQNFRGENRPESGHLQGRGAEHH